MKNEELQTFAKLIQPLRTEQLKRLLFVLSSATYYGIPIYSIIREIETGIEEKEFNKKKTFKEPVMYRLASIPVAIQNFFYGIGWHNQSYKKLTEQAIKLVVDRLLT